MIKNVQNVIDDYVARFTSLNIEEQELRKEYSTSSEEMETFYEEKNKIASAFINDCVENPEIIEILRTIMK